MNARQRRFCDEYLIDCNATKAAIRAGYSARFARGNAHKMVANSGMKTYIEQQLEAIHNEKTADAKEIMEYLTSVMRGEAQATVVVVEGTGDGCSEAREMVKSPDERERLKAAELLGKRFGLFKDTVSITAPIPVVIHDDLDEDDDE
ncbi:terminase small subunit [Chakrabartyella piscis]|uniref:terminase small subunit n=1 Tax=Chakrabartyella piscis TaxID=2918914 RepID=UPI0029589388|nr:terminase small subunit [Chakrabartyella piscis]